MRKNQPVSSLPSPLNRVLLSLLVPLAAATFLYNFAAGGNLNSRPALALFLGVLGAASWILGLRWYGLPGLGLRGGRPLFASIGFAVLAWLVVFLARLYFVDSRGLGSTGAAAEFFHLLVFEAFCTQLYAFGPFFRSVADWRGPLTASIASGVLFGFIGFTYFGESLLNQFQQLDVIFVTGPSLWQGILFFVIWGILYGVIRLRSGSILGSILVQALQSFTTWFVLLPGGEWDPQWQNWMYLIVGLFFIIIIWRLWPKTEEDYRV